MASAKLTRTFSAGNRKTFTFSAWVKRNGTSTGYEGLCIASGGDQGIFFKDHSISFFINGAAERKTTRVFRDVNGWYHFVLAVDSTQGTAADRVKFYVNGVQETAYDNSNYPTQDSDGLFNNNAGTFVLGGHSTSSYFFDGEMAHVHYVDGTAYTPTTFGETDATTGIWKPKTAPSVTYGTNGFFLKFDNSGNMGLDSAGSNNLTTSGTIIQNKDTPTNVFATLNPLDYSPNPATLQNANTTYNKSSTGSGHNATMTGTLGVTKGKYYFEFKPTNTSAFVAGIVRTNHGLPNSEGYYGTDAGSYGITNGGKMVGGSESSVSYSYSANDIFGMAFDLDNGKFYVHVNGTYLTSGDPTSGSTGTGSLGDISLGSNIYVPLVSNANYDQTNVMHFNFGNGYFGTTAVSSAQNPDDGNGIFEYDVPAGYRALCTKSINAEEYS